MTLDELAVIWQRYHRINRTFAPATGFSDELTVMQALLLDCIRSGPRRVTELSEQLTFGTNVGYNLDKLEGQKLLRRTTIESDRRSKFVEITAKGIQAVDRFADAIANTQTPA